MFSQQIASHGLVDLEVKAEGDIWIDDHHTTEDIALALGQCLSQALGTRAGIHRFGDFTAPLDEALIHVVMVCRPEKKKKRKERKKNSFIDKQKIERREIKPLLNCLQRMKSSSYPRERT